jgi:CheY-like chemotaxis protein
VLVVEDDERTREALVDILDASGAGIIEADSAVAAMKAFRERHPDVLLCDIAMPGEDGYSLMRRIRALSPEEGGTVPAVALTALTAPEDRERALAAGFQTPLDKPSTSEAICAAIAALVSRPGAGRARE